MTKDVSSVDTINYELLRNNIDNFIKKISRKYDNKNCLMLDVGPEVHAGAKKYFKKSKVETCDIDSSYDVDYIIVYVKKMII